MALNAEAEIERALVYPPKGDDPYLGGQTVADLVRKCARARSTVYRCLDALHAWNRAHAVDRVVAHPRGRPATVRLWFRGPPRPGPP